MLTTMVSHAKKTCVMLSCFFLILGIMYTVGLCAQAATSFGYLRQNGMGSTAPLMVALYLAPAMHAIQILALALFSHRMSKGDAILTRTGERLSLALLIAMLLTGATSIAVGLYAKDVVFKADASSLTDFIFFLDVQSVLLLGCAVILLISFRATREIRSEIAEFI